MLVPNYVAGALIGRRGAKIVEIEQASRCQVQLSGVDGFFPGTLERILLAAGSLEGLHVCLDHVLQQLRALVADENQRQTVLKLAVPSSACSSIIGVRGTNVQRLQEATGCVVNVSPRIDGMQERLVTLHGASAAVLVGARQVCGIVQNDPHVREHATIAYSVQLETGVWDSARGQPRNAGSPVLHRLDVAADNWTKHDLIEYLQGAAPRELLERRHLIGHIHNVIKGNNKQSLLEAVEETWHFRGGHGPARE